MNKIQYSGPVFDKKEIKAAVKCLKSGWYGVSKETATAEIELAEIMDTPGSVLTNSGSSANLLIIAALVHQGRLKKGDEVLVPACTFPTTINPLIQYGIKPVLCDIDINTLNIDPIDVARKITKKSKAIIAMHNLGNPCDIDSLTEICDKENLMLIEDNCDALGSRYRNRPTGSFGEASSASFYVAHQLTAIEGGAVFSNSPTFLRIVRSLRDWGRACPYFCNVCQISLNPDSQCRMQRRVESDLPEDYDNKYTYSTIGYNLKPIELQAAILNEQLKKFDNFIAARKKNFATINNYIQENWSGWTEEIAHYTNADPCWFAYPMTLSKNAPFTRREVVDWLNNAGIETRYLFSGNIARHPAYKGVLKADGLPNSDYVLENTFFLGVYPKIQTKEMEYILRTLERFWHKH